jgi:hypothetical protein
LTSKRGQFIVALLDLEPALLRRQPPPRSQAARAGHLQWDPPTAQQARHGARLFRYQPSLRRGGLPPREHGADINTRWNSHEPASILHHLVFYGDYESMRFLIDRGIDMTIKDDRLELDGTGLRALGREGPGDGPVAGGGGTAAGTETMSTVQGTCLTRLDILGERDILSYT